MATDVAVFNSFLELNTSFIDFIMIVIRYVLTFYSCIFTKVIHLHSHFVFNTIMHFSPFFSKVINIPTK